MTVERHAIGAPRSRAAICSSSRSGPSPTISTEKRRLRCFNARAAFKAGPSASQRRANRRPRYARRSGLKRASRENAQVYPVMHHDHSLGKEGPLRRSRILRSNIAVVDLKARPACAQPAQQPAVNSLIRIERAAHRAWCNRRPFDAAVGGVIQIKLKECRSRVVGLHAWSRKRRAQPPTTIGD